MRTVVRAQVSPNGKSVRVGWTLYGGSCVARAYGRTTQGINGLVIERISVNPNGSFHGVDRTKAKYTRTHVSEVYGQFTADGSYVKLRLRQKLYAYQSASSWARCDGRWFSFGACYRGENDRCAKPPQPTATDE